jgi:bifunctional UDP-N-acetylglucosamine pyrophosphorylase/glucosamine-1-phosphate N-acetyltransferase
LPHVALVLAAGLGTRMRSRTPKVLHRLAGRPMIDLVLAAVREAGATPVVVVGPDAREVREHLAGIPVVVQDPPRGTGHAVQIALPALPRDGQAYIVYGDTPLLRSKTLSAMRAAHESAGAVLTLLTGEPEPPSAYGLIERGPDGRVVRIVETKGDAAAQRRLGERNLGAYVADLAWLRSAAPRLRENASGEIYLTDLVALAEQDGRRVAAHCLDDAREGAGINNRAELALLETVYRDRIREGHMLGGVTMQDPSSTFVDADVEIGEDTVLLAGTILEGRTRIGRDCRIGPRATIRDTVVGDRCTVGESFLEDSVLEDEVKVGPYCHLRNGAYLERGVDIGDHAEIKNSRLGAGTKCHHFSYLGDATIGAMVNIGAGTITLNFDGVRKHRTLIGDRAFIGSDTLLRAPVSVGEGAVTGAGAVVTKDVPPGMVAVGMPARAIKRRPRGTEAE